MVSSKLPGCLLITETLDIHVSEDLNFAIIYFCTLRSQSPSHKPVRAHPVSSFVYPSNIHSFKHSHTYLSNTSSGLSLGSSSFRLSPS